MPILPPPAAPARPGPTTPPRRDAGPGAAARRLARLLPLAALAALPAAPAVAQPAPAPPPAAAEAPAPRPRARPPAPAAQGAGQGTGQGPGQGTGAGPGAAAPAQGGPARPPGTNSIVAVVNGDVVSRADIESRRRLFALNAGLPIAPEVLDRLTGQVTRLQIDERLRLQEIQRRRIPVTDEEVAEALGELEQRNGLPAGALRAQLRQANVEPRILFDQIRAQIGWSRLVRQQLGAQANPSEAEVGEQVADARARAGQPEFLVSEIFVPVDDPAQEAETRRFVEEVITQLRRGVPFPIVATQFSQAQSALQGGDLGWTRKDAVDPEVAALLDPMPAGAISNPVRVAGGFQIVAMRQKREAGKDLATLLTMRQAFFPFATPLDPEAPTEQQRAQVERAQRLQGGRGCEAVEAAARAAGGDRPADPGPVRLETVNPPPLRALLAGLTPGRPSQPIIAPDGVVVIAVCTRETRNLAEVTPDQAKAALVRDRAERLSRQIQRDLRRRAQIEMRS